MGWMRGDSIGHGSSSAIVSVGRFLDSKKVFAVKSMELSKSEILQREQSILSCLSSPRIVGYIGCDVTTDEAGKPPMYNLMMEYVSGGSLSDAIHGGCLDLGAIASYTGDVLCGLEYIHERGLVHCDIKAANILIGAAQGGAKIADFGCAKWDENDDSGSRVLVAGTPAFMAPEVARGEEQSFPADIWALGCTIIEMATGSPPWTADTSDPIAAIHRIGYSGEVPEIPTCLSENGKDFLARCLTKDPKERWSATQLLNHPFLQNTKTSLWNSNSPTSILDEEALGNSREEDSETPRYPTHISTCSGSSSTCSSSARDRLGRIQSVAPNWESEDDDWITVR